jgi:hypothetical protein
LLCASERSAQLYQTDMIRHRIGFALLWMRNSSATGKSFISLIPDLNAFLRVSHFSERTCASIITIAMLSFRQVTLQNFHLASAIILDPRWNETDSYVLRVLWVFYELLRVRPPEHSLRLGVFVNLGSRSDGYVWFCRTSFGCNHQCYIGVLLDLGDFPSVNFGEC